MRFGEVWGDLHGAGEKEFESLLPEGEQIWSVVGKPKKLQKILLISKMQHETQYFPGSAGSVIDSLLFIGNQGVYGPYGGDGGDSFASERPGKWSTDF